jgi:HAD superfamily hydrolase (TIGR01662 family)
VARSPQQQAVFFELDGVITGAPRLDDEGRVPYLAGALNALASIDTRTFLIFVTSNREDMAFGRLRERDFKKLCEQFLTDANELRIPIAKIYSCPFHPKGRGRFKKESVFRKPAPGMFKMAQQEFELNLARSWHIGHTTLDMLAGSRAGVGTILVMTGEGGKDGTFHVEPHRTARDITDAVKQIQEFEMALRR